MQGVRMAFGKWGGRPHWELDTLALGEDEHGSWLGVPAGTTMVRPGAEFRSPTDQVILLPDRPYVASFYAPGDGPCHTYVDITTVPVLDGTTAAAVDLDLDVVRGWSGRVWVDDEDEFAEHRVRLGYPDDLVELAVTSCEEVRRAVVAARPPFDGPTSQRWLGVLSEVMMSS